MIPRMPTVLRFVSLNGGFGAANRSLIGPRPGTGLHQLVALKQPFAGCVKLRPKFIEPGRIARNAQMPLNVFVALHTTFSSPNC
jgi:hypothetical protein